MFRGLERATAAPLCLAAGAPAAARTTPQPVPQPGGAPRRFRILHFPPARRGAVKGGSERRYRQPFPLFA